MSVPEALPRLGVLVSGRGSNLQSIIDAIRDGRLRAVVGIVISNRQHAAGLDRARQAGIETRWINPKDFPDRQAYDRELAAVLADHHVQLVCLAGFMRLVTAPLLDAFSQRIVNIHPSLLPAFPGLEAQRQALEHGVRVTGVTVHLATAGLDDGPIVLQRAVPVLDDDTRETLSARILTEEHRIYPEAIQILLDGEWHLDGRRFIRTRQDAASI